MKISIIGGAGRVGSSIGFAILLRDLPVDELVLYDIVESVKGDAWDLEHASAGLKNKVKITGTQKIEDCNDSDILVMAAGAPLSKSGTLDRSKLITKNLGILNSVFDGLKDNGKTIYILISNPVDVLTYFLAKRIGDRKRVLGVSTLTDTLRMNTFSKGQLIGEHSGYMVSLDTSVDTKKISQMGLDVVELKGGTWFTTPVGVTNIIECVAKDSKKVLPISVSLENEFGFSDVSLSVPCEVTKRGAEIKEVKLTAKPILEPTLPAPPIIEIFMVYFFL